MPAATAGAMRPKTPVDGVDGLVLGQQYYVTRGGQRRPATVLEARVAKGAREVYISFLGEDKRLDTWVPQDEIGEPVAGPSRTPTKRIRSDTIDELGEGRRDTPASLPSTPEREHAAMTRVRNFEDVRFGEYLIKTWYFSPYPVAADEALSSVPPHSANGARKRKLSVANGDEGHKPHLAESASAVPPKVEGLRGRLWVCDLCFKYMRTRAEYTGPTLTAQSACDLLRPPGRKVYERGSHSIFEVDGAEATLYCQNLSLFGKLFIDHKSVFFHVENFLFYVFCDASTSRRDQVLAFFSKEKLSYDDYNLACIVTFPPFQNCGFGKLLIEFSYYLTRHPSTRPASLSPGTPERPLSDLGLKGYTAYWAAAIIRLCRRLLADAEPVGLTPVKGKVDGRTLRRARADAETVNVDGVAMTKTTLSRGQYSIQTTLSDLARAAHIRTDDAALTLAELGFLRHRRNISASAAAAAPNVAVHTSETAVEPTIQSGASAGEWKDVEVVISRDAVEAMCRKWKVRDTGLLEERYVLL